MQHTRISPTAALTARARTFTDIPLAHELADLLNRRQADYLPLVLEGRYKTINVALKASRPRQVLEFASGFLPRGMEMTADPDLYYVETDLPDVIELKESLCRQLVGERSNLRFAPFEVTGGEIESLPLLPQPVAVVCEGLLMYLDLAEKAAVCATVRNLLRRHGGVWLTSDFSATAGMRSWIPQIPTVGRKLERLSQLTGRSLADNAFEDLEEARSFVAEQGFELQEFSQLDLLEELSCREILGYPDQFVNEVLGRRPIFALTLGGEPSMGAS